MEIDSEGVEHPGATFAAYNGVRTGMFPVKYDAVRKKALWFYFMATEVTGKVTAPKTLLCNHALLDISMSSQYGSSKFVFEQSSEKLLKPIVCYAYAC